MFKFAEIFEKRHLSALIVNFRGRIRALGTTVLGGGLKYLTHVVFKTVDENFNHPEPSNYARELVLELGLPQTTTAVFLTAVDVLDNKVVKYSEKPVDILTICTVGLENPSCIYSLGSSPNSVSTINILGVVDVELTDEGLVDLFRTITEAKTLAVVDLGLSCGSYRASGTVSDAVIAGHTIANSHKDRIKYAGMATDIGNAIARLVYESVHEAVLKNLTDDEELKLITDFSLDELVDLALKAYSRSPVPGIDLDYVRRLVREELRSLIQDPNVWSFIHCAKCLDLLGSVGRIRGLSVQEYLDDSTRIVADEILGIALALYINGWKALFNYYWIENMKSKDELAEIGKASMFMDDIITSIIGSILSKAYDKLLR